MHPITLFEGRQDAEQCSPGLPLPSLGMAHAMTRIAESFIYWS
ncbi:hypothetical protein AB0G87_31975 [Streptomyces asoensis]